MSAILSFTRSATTRAFSPASSITTPTPDQVRLIARAASLAGEDAEAYYYLSEYRLMTGDLVGGVNYLRQALEMPELQEIQRIRFQARIDFIREFMTEEQLTQLQRSRPNGISASTGG